MALTLEDHERRIAALELAQSATGDALTRLDRKVDRLTARVDALHHVTAELIAESDRANAKLIAESEQRLTDRINSIEQRLTDRIGSTERRFTDLLNERFDAVMVALDRFTNPPKN
jgi:hypothetical protein